MKNLPVMQETQEVEVLSLGQEDLLEKEMATHSSILAWEIPWTKDPGGYSLTWRKESDTTERPSARTNISKALCVHAKSLQLCRLFETPWTVAHQAPLPTGFSRKEYWSGLPCPPPGESSQPRDQTCIS